MIDSLTFVVMAMTVPRVGDDDTPLPGKPSPPFHSVGGASRSLVCFFLFPPRASNLCARPFALLLLLRRLVSGHRTLEPSQRRDGLSTEVNLDEPKARSRSKEHHGRARVHTRVHQSPDSFPSSTVRELLPGWRCSRADGTPPAPPTTH